MKMRFCLGIEYTFSLDTVGRKYWKECWYHWCFIGICITWWYILYCFFKNAWNVSL